MNRAKRILVILLFFTAESRAMNDERPADQAEQANVAHCAQKMEQLNLNDLDTQEPNFKEIVAYCCSRADGRRPIRESFVKAMKKRQEKFFSPEFVKSVASAAMGVQKYEHNGCRVNSVVFDPTGRLLATGTSDDSKARIFNVATGKCVAEVDHIGVVHSIAFNPTGKWLATASSNRMRIVDIANGECIFKVEHDSGVNSVVFDSSGERIATGCDDSKARIFNITSGKCVTKFNHTDWVRSVAFDPSGNLLATGCDDKKVRIFSIENEKCIGEFDHEEWKLAIRFDPSGKLLATGCGDGKARIFDIASKKCVAEFDHEDWGLSIAFDPSGELLASAGQVRIFNIANRECIGEFGYGSAVAFDPSGELLATGCADGKARIFNLKNWASAREFLTLPENIDQLYLLQACDLAMQEEQYVHVSDEQWTTFQTLPVQMQKALRKYIVTGEQYNRIKNKPR